MSVAATHFFNHVEPFVDYRKTIYEASDETIRSNCIDLHLFKDFVKERNAECIDGPTVMDFQYYLKQERKNTGPSTREQVKELFDNIDRSNFLAIRDYAVYALMYDLGLRVGEVYKLHLEDIDLKNKTLTVLGKGKRRRELYLNAEMVQILSEWLAVRHNFKNSEPSNALFISKKGNRLAIRTIEDNMKKLVDRLGLKVHFKVTCHTLRHTFASHLNDNGEDILVIQSLLGHSSPRSTRIYIHPSQQRIRAALEKLPGVIYMNQLLESGVLNLNFQAQHRQRE